MEWNFGSVYFFTSMIFLSLCYLSHCNLLVNYKLFYHHWATLRWPLWKTWFIYCPWPELKCLFHPIYPNFRWRISIRNLWRLLIWSWKHCKISWGKHYIVSQSILFFMLLNFGTSLRLYDWKLSYWEHLPEKKKKKR